MPVCIILIWFLTSTGLAKVDKEMRKKILIGVTLVFLTCSLLALHIQLHGRSILQTEIRSHNSTLGPRVNAEASHIVSQSDVPRIPVKHIAYIKTHKTGSSTIWSVLINYAINNNLTIALPARGSGNKLGWPDSFSEGDAVPPKPDVLCHHSRFSDAMLDYMPNDTVYLTSVRDPAHQLHSAYDYFHADKNCFNMSFEDFINKPGKDSTFVGKCSPYYKWWLMNGQLYDLGLDTSELSPSNPKHKATVLQKIKDIDRQFSMVLVLERFDESLIIMRDLLNWTTEDVVYFKKNFQIEIPNKVRQRYTELQHSLAREWNWADELLHLHFTNKLEAMVNLKPDYYREEVKALVKRSDLWLSRCVRQVIPAAQADNSYLSLYADGIGSYSLTAKGKQSDQCVRLAMGEVAKIRLLNSGTAINSKTFLQGEKKMT